MHGHLRQFRAVLLSCTTRRAGHLGSDAPSLGGYTARGKRAKLIPQRRFRSHNRSLKEDQFSQSVAIAPNVTKSRLRAALTGHPPELFGTCFHTTQMSRPCCGCELHGLQTSRGVTPVCDGAPKRAASGQLTHIDCPVDASKCSRKLRYL